MRGPLAAAAALGALALLSACATAPLVAPAAPPLTAPPSAATPSASAAVSAPAAAQTLVPLWRLAGWSQEDHLAALQAFKAGCGVARATVWRAVCARARQQSDTTEASAKAFFEDNFRADLRGGAGLLTAYFAPQYPARDAPDDVFCAPVRPGPETPYPADPVDALLADSQGPAVRTGIGADRSGIEAEPAARALAWMRPEDLYFLQIQGSGTLVFPDGRRRKALYAGDNGRPYIGIARPMIAQGLLANDRASGDAIRGWLAAHRGAEAQAVMDQNPRYVFFTLVQDDEREPAGAAGVALPAGRALAVDPSYHAYGELYWIDATAPVLTGAVRTYRRLAIALDTGGAIRGDVRADLYLGRGDQAGAEAGRVRHPLLLIRLEPLTSDGRTAGGKDEALPQGR